MIRRVAHKFTTTNPIWTLAAIAIVFVIAAGGISLALIATSSAAAAGRDAKHAVQCTNQSLHTRNDPNMRDRTAQDALNQAQDALNEAELRDVRILTTGDAAARASAAANLQQALTSQHQAYTAYKTTRARDDAIRAAHPLGKC